MKIISLGPAHPLRGGIAEFNESMSREFLSQGHELKIFSYKLQYPSLFFPGKTQYTSSLKPDYLDIQNPLSSISLSSWLKTVENIRREGPDLVIIHYWMPFFIPSLGFIAHKLRAVKSIKTILLAHNLIPHETQPGTRFLTRYLIKNIDGIVSLSSKVQADAKKFRPNLPSIVLPHPIYDIFGEKPERHLALKKLGLNGKARYILFFGLVRKYKGLDLLLQALKSVKNRSVNLIIAGEFYGKKDEYLKIIASEKIGKRIILKDFFIPAAEVKYYFSAAELLVLPYKSATQSGVAQIAFHFEIPAIVTRVGGLPETIEEGKTGYIAEPNPESIAAAINRYFDDPAKEALLANIKRKKEEYSWKNFVLQFEAFVMGI